jgi:hypothetical protein
LEIQGDKNNRMKLNLLIILNLLKIRHFKDLSTYAIVVRNQNVSLIDGNNPEGLVPRQQRFIINVCSYNL